MNRQRSGKNYEDILTRISDEPIGRGRISNGLNVNIAARKQLDLFDSLTDEDRNSLLIQDRERLVDRRGKPLSLSVEDIQLIKALSSYLPFHSQEIREYISSIDTLDGSGHTDPSNKIKQPIQMALSTLQISKDIIGDTKEKSLRLIENRLKRLAGIKQVQTFYTKEGKYTAVRPLIALLDEVYKHYSEVRSTRGRKKTEAEAEKEDKILIGANVVYTSLFLYKATKEYCPIYKQRLFDVWRRNKTEIFAILLSDLESKWMQYYVAAIKAGKAAAEEYKQLKKEDKGEYFKKVNTAKKAARIYTANTITIRNRLTTDYEGNRKMVRQFIPDLQRAIASLVEYGIITKESHVTKDKSKVCFFYNPDFIADEIEKLLPDT